MDFPPRGYSAFPQNPGAVHGVVAKVDGTTVAAGNSKLMKKLGIEYKDCHSVGTIIHLAIDGAYAGHIVISDVEKPTSRQAIAQLKKAGVEKTVMTFFQENIHFFSGSMQRRKHREYRFLAGKHLLMEYIVGFKHAFHFYSFSKYCD